MNEGVGNQSTVTDTLLVPSDLRKHCALKLILCSNISKSRERKLMFGIDFTHWIGAMAIELSFHKAHTTRRSLAYATWYIASSAYESSGN